MRKFGTPTAMVMAMAMPDGPTRLSAAQQACGGRPDCNDNSNAVYPGADEYCNTVDDDCDGAVDGAAVDAHLVRRPRW